MLNTAKALYQFYSGFGIPAYAENSVPEEAELPYITYPVVETEPLEQGTHYCQIWDRSTSNAGILGKADAIKQALGKTGVTLDCEGGGYVVLRPATPFAQVMIDADPSIRRAYINLLINCYHL